MTGSEAEDDMPHQLARPGAAPLYVGLSERARLTIIVLSGFVAIINLLMAWYFAFAAENSLHLAQTDMLPFKSWVDLMSSGQLSNEARYDLSARAMSIVASLKLVSNKQAIILTCYGAAFALMAIGFALFLIGADGAFKVMASSQDKSKLAISGTAPGLLCFLISGGLIVTGVLHRSEIRPPEIASNLAQQLSGPPDQADPCAFKDLISGECMTREQHQQKRR